MPPPFRTPTLGLAAVSVAAFAVASVATYRPSGSTDRALAFSALKRALGSLEADNLGSTARVAAYRDGLDETDALLKRALRGNPTDTASIQRLALVRWESSVLAESPDFDAVSFLTRIAAERAPRVPEIQADLGELFYKMGHVDEAAPFMKRAVELSPAMTNRVVGIMRAAAVKPQDILAALPSDPAVSIAVKDLFIDSEEGLAYLAHVEPQLADATPALLATYGEACLQLEVPQRLADRIAALPYARDPALRAERACQAAHASLSLGDRGRALAFADEARRATPLDSRMLEFYGEVALMSGRGTDAEGAFARSLELILVGADQPAHRARLYDALGRSLEAQGRADVAYDAYRHAIAIDPSMTHAQVRLDFYEHRSPDAARR